MVESMVEKVARAIEDEGPVGCCVIEPGQALKIARAAIEAMREPTDAVMDAINEHAGSIAPEYAWRDGIDAALAEQQS